MNSLSEKQRQHLKSIAIKYAQSAKFYLQYVNLNAPETVLWHLPVGKYYTYTHASRAVCELVLPVTSHMQQLLHRTKYSFSGWKMRISGYLIVFLGFLDRCRQSCIIYNLEDSDDRLVELYVNLKIALSILQDFADQCSRLQQDDNDREDMRITRECIMDLIDKIAVFEGDVSVSSVDRDKKLMLGPGPKQQRDLTSSRLQRLQLGSVPRRL